MEAAEITIAVTVYNRRDYLKQSIGSALAQTQRVRVIVVEDCGPDAELQSFVKSEFGSRVEYFRNPQRRGIFGNWNACIEYGQTRWLSILHDDDYLKPEFVSTMIELNRQAGERGLYFGHTLIVDEEGRLLPEVTRPPLASTWAPVTLAEVVFRAPFPFPGQLFRVEFARAFGGFRETSQFCGEWELWTKLIARHGAAQTKATVAAFRNHGGWTRGTNRLARTGKTMGLITIQRKRNAALARRSGLEVRYDRRVELSRSPVPTRHLLKHGMYFSDRYLAYNAGLLQHSKAPHWRYRVFQTFANLCGPRSIRWASRWWNRFHY